jgi:integrase
LSSGPARIVGVPLQIVAANLGHVDTRMTEKHYAHLSPSHIAEVIRAAMPKLGIVTRTNVVTLG